MLYYYTILYFYNILLIFLSLLPFFPNDFNILTCDFWNSINFNQSVWSIAHIAEYDALYLY